MKRVIYIILILSCAGTLSAQKRKNIQIHRIKTITVSDQDLEKGNGSAVKESISRYDELGNFIELFEYDSKGNEKTHESYEYDENGNKVKEIHYKSNNVKDKVIEYTYDDDGNKIKEVHYKANMIKDKVIEYIYNDGLKNERIVYYPNGKVKSKKKYVYEFQ